MERIVVARRFSNMSDAAYKVQTPCNEDFHLLLLTLASAHAGHYIDGLCHTVTCLNVFMSTEGVPDRFCVLLEQPRLSRYRVLVLVQNIF